MRGFGADAMITQNLLEKWKVDILKDNLLVSYGIFYVHALRDPIILETMKSSPHWRPWVDLTPQEEEIWFTTNRCQNFEEKDLFELLLEYWYKIFILDDHFEVRFSNIDGLGLYSKVEGVMIKNFC